MEAPPPPLILICQQLVAGTTALSWRWRSVTPIILQIRLRSSVARCGRTAMIHIRRVRVEPLPSRSSAPPLTPSWQRLGPMERPSVPREPP